MKFAIQVNSPPWRGPFSETAYQFSRQALALGHEIVRVFFYHEGAYHGMRWMSPAADEMPLAQRWSKLAAEQGVDLVICISAAHRRGLLEAGESLAQGKQDDDVAAGFRIAGLGQWVDACLKADRLLVFGA